MLSCGLKQAPPTTSKVGESFFTITSISPLSGAQSLPIGPKAAVVSTVAKKFAEPLPIPLLENLAPIAVKHQHTWPLGHCALKPCVQAPSETVRLPLMLPLSRTTLPAAAFAEVPEADGHPLLHS